jgi:hypothetical protein
VRGDREERESLGLCTSLQIIVIRLSHPKLVRDFDNRLTVHGSRDSPMTATGETRVSHVTSPETVTPLGIAWFQCRWQIRHADFCVKWHAMTRSVL